MNLNVINDTKKLIQDMFKRKIQVTYLYTQGDFVTYKYLLNNKVEEVPFYKFKLKKDVENNIYNFLGLQSKKKPLHRVM